jgi:hypothetical protein
MTIPKGDVFDIIYSRYHDILGDDAETGADDE